MAAYTSNTAIQFNPFATPVPSVPHSHNGDDTAPASVRHSQWGGSQDGGYAHSEQQPSLKQRRFKSARLIGEYEKPWVEDKFNKGRERWDYIIFWTCNFIGFGIGALVCYRAWVSVPHHDYCLVLDDNFGTLDPSTWSHEVQLGGFGTGSFDWTTSSPSNSYVDGNGLHIMPTLTLQDPDSGITTDQFMNGYTLNLTADATCTGFGNGSCAMTSNSTENKILNPVRSARLTTKGKKSITYGRVEVVAKMPKGDWLWPAIWMMPEKDTYGPWPASGEIDLAEIRGNEGGDKYPDGRDSSGAAVHWGTSPEVDMFWKTSGKHNVRRTDYSEEYHTYGLEWSEDYMFMFLDSKLLQVQYINFRGKMDMYTKGGFGSMTVNGSVPENPWSGTGRTNTPFDQPFYLILNVAVGGTNGFFRDSIGGKPWVDGSANAMYDFWKANGTWSKTWGEGEERSMTVKSVRMWQEGKCGAV